MTTSDKYFSSRRRVIAGRYAALIVNDQEVYRVGLRDRRHPPILGTLKRFWSAVSKKDKIVLRLAWKTCILEYTRDYQSGRFVYSGFIFTGLTRDTETSSRPDGALAGYPLTPEQCSPPPFGSAVLFE